MAKVEPDLNWPLKVMLTLLCALAVVVIVAAFVNGGR